MKLEDQSKRKINAYYRSTDESHLWPIRNRFNATERAIRRIIKFQRESGCSIEGLEYIQVLDAEISRIVNSAV